MSPSARVLSCCLLQAAITAVFVKAGASSPAPDLDETSFYTAAVYQNAIVGGDDGGCTPSPTQPCHGPAVRDANLHKFGIAMARARAKGADIIVFGEGAVDSDLWNPGPWQRHFACESIPQPGMIAPCDAPGSERFPITQRASCLARDHNIVTVLNYCDVQPCQNASRPCKGNSDVDCCPASGVELFNTQVAFSEKGELLAKYHKTHNYDTAPDRGETSNGLCCWPPRLDMQYFDTSFGVRFGMHICFDILFHTPGAALALNSTLGIRDFVYSSHWEATGPPMLPAMEVQQGWSRGLGVNLLAANAGLGYRHAGSGIYSRGRALAEHYDPNKAHDDQLLIARVPKLQARTAADHQVWNQRKGHVMAPPVPAASFQEWGILPGGGGGATTLTLNATVSSGGFVCTLTAALPANLSFPSIMDRYLLMAVNGSWMGRKNLPSRSCVVVRCGDLSKQQCAARATCADYQDSECAAGRSLYNVAKDLSAVTVWDHIVLSGSFEAGDLVLPMVGTSMGQIVEESNISFAQGSMRVSLDKPLLNAMLFAMPSAGSTNGAARPDGVSDAVLV